MSKVAGNKEMEKDPMEWSTDNWGVHIAYHSSSVIYSLEEEMFNWPCPPKKTKVNDVSDEAVDFFADLKKRHKLVIVKRKEKNISLDEAQQLARYLIDLGDGDLESNAPKKILDDRFYVCFGNIYIVYPFRKIVAKQERRKIVISQNCLGEDITYYWDYGDKIEYVRSRNWATSLYDQHWTPYVDKIFYDQDSFDRIRRNASEYVMRYMLSEILKHKPFKPFREENSSIHRRDVYAMAKIIFASQNI